MAKLTFKTEKCKGCGLCVDACPKGVLALAEAFQNKRKSCETDGVEVV